MHGSGTRQGRHTGGDLEGQHGGQQQQSSTDQGCCMIWGIPIRWAGSATRMRFSRSLHSSDALICGGKLYSTFRMRYTTEHSNACCLASFTVVDSDRSKVMARTAGHRQGSGYVIPMQDRTVKILWGNCRELDRAHGKGRGSECSTGRGDSRAGQPRAGGKGRGWGRIPHSQQGKSQGRAGWR